MSKDKVYKETLAEWRKKHFTEMQTNMEIAKEIRDDSEAKAKDRIDAIKTISRMLGTLAPEKIEKKEAVVKTESPFTASETKKLNVRLKATLGDQWIKSKENI